MKGSEMKKLINILCCAVCVAIAMGITHAWNELVMYLLFVIGITLALVSYFLNEPRVL